MVLAEIQTRHPDRISGKVYAQRHPSQLILCARSLLSTGSFVATHTNNSIFSSLSFDRSYHLMAVAAARGDKRSVREASGLEGLDQLRFVFEKHARCVRYAVRL